MCPTTFVFGFAIGRYATQVHEFRITAVMTSDAITIQYRLNFFDEAKATSLPIEWLELLSTSLPCNCILLLKGVIICILLIVTAHTGLVLAGSDRVPRSGGLNDLPLGI